MNIVPPIVSPQALARYCYTVCQEKRFSYEVLFSYPEADADKQPVIGGRTTNIAFGTWKKFFSVLTVTDEAQKHGHPAGNVEKVYFFAMRHVLLCGMHLLFTGGYFYSNICGII